MHLPDINFWLALTIDSHVHHGKADAWFANHFDEHCSFCRTTQQGYLRLLTNLNIFGSAASTMQEAWQEYDRMLASQYVGYLDEPVGVDLIWRGFTNRHTYSPKLWNDAYLAAFAITADLEIVTFDAGFRQFPGVKLTLLA